MLAFEQEMYDSMLATSIGALTTLIQAAGIDKVFKSEVRCPVEMYHISISFTTIRFAQAYQEQWSC